MEHRLFSSINVQNYEIGVAELPLQGNRFGVSPWTSFLLRLPMKFASDCLRLHSSFRKQRAGLARSRKRRGAKLGVLRPRDWRLLFESSLRPFKVKSEKIFIHIPKEVKYHKAGPIFGAAVREGFAVRYDTAAPFLGPPGGPSSGSVFVAHLLNAALDAVPQSRPPLLMNRDETAILRHVSGLRGTATDFKDASGYWSGTVVGTQKFHPLCLPASQAMPVSKWIFAVRLDSTWTHLYNASASASWQRGGQCHLRGPDGTAIAQYADGSHSCNKKLIWDLRSLVTTICDRSCKCSPIPQWRFHLSPCVPVWR